MFFFLIQKSESSWIIAGRVPYGISETP